MHRLVVARVCLPGDNESSRSLLTGTIPTRAEHAAAINSGDIDGVEMTSLSNLYNGIDPYSLPEWYRYLCCGHFVAAVAGMDKMQATTAVGAVRTSSSGRESTLRQLCTRLSANLSKASGRPGNKKSLRLRWLCESSRSMWAFSQLSRFLLLASLGVVASGVAAPMSRPGWCRREKKSKLRNL